MCVCGESGGVGGVRRGLEEDNGPGTEVLKQLQLGWLQRESRVHISGPRRSSCTNVNLVTCEER